MAIEKKESNVSPIKEGTCPHCGANLNFSQKDRSEGERILCPKCKKEFGIEEAKVSKGKKKGKGCLIAIIILVGLFLIGIMALSSVDKEEGDLEEAGEQEVVEQKEEEKQEETEVSEEEEEIVKEEESTAPEYPRLTEETMDRNLILSCAGGDEVVLWDLPTSAGEGARGRDKVPCGIYGWAFNEYYNEELDISFFAINTLDSRVDNAYGWITEDLISWRE